MCKPNYFHINEVVFSVNICQCKHENNVNKAILKITLITVATNLAIFIKDLATFSYKQTTIFTLDIIVSVKVHLVYLKRVEDPPD